MDISLTITAVGLAIAAGVADYKAVKEELTKRALGIYTVLGAAFTAFFVIYGEKFFSQF